MTIGAIAIWIAVVALALTLPRLAPRGDTRGTLVIGGGVGFTVLVLGVLLSVGLTPLPRMLTPGPAGAVSVDVTGQQWWWRVRYIVPGGTPVDAANELRLPVDRRTNLRLTSRDVIHSFWLPSMAGKLDMIPGRVNHLAVEPTRTGAYRGACAEFCGASHARMNFDVIVMEPAAFDAWLAAQAQPAAAPASPEAVRGQTGFLTYGCVTCHTIRGTDARGTLGPDLTHVGSRPTIAAGLLPTTADSLEQWITHTQTYKPGAYMPPFSTLPPEELQALGAYLVGLR
jgi:cytochrome c oxidase subunit 2